jgi:hypothetical protein
VNRLRQTLSETIKLWEHFNSANGDIDYFSDSKSPDNFQDRIKLSLCEINETFQTLETLQRKLDGLIVLCKDSENAVS